MTEPHKADGSHRKKPRSPLQVLRDYTLYVLISLCLIVSIFWMAKSGVSDKTVHVYLDIFLSTVLVFSILIPAYKSLWKEPLFWIAALILLIAHVVIWTLLLMHTQLAQWRVRSTMYLTLPELIAMSACGEWLRRYLHRRHRKASRHIAEVHSGQ